MKNRTTYLLITCVIALAALPCLHYSGSAQDRPEGYWEIEKGEVIVTRSGKVTLTKPFDLKKGGTVHNVFPGGSGVVEWHIEMIPKDVPEIIKGDDGQAVVTGHIYVEAQRSNGWPDFLKFGINDDGQTASGETLTGFGGGEGYSNIAKLGKREEAWFSTAGLSLPRTGEDFAVRVLLRLTYKATISYKDADTYAFNFHYKWRTGRVTATAAAAETTSRADLGMGRRRVGAGG